MGKKLFHRIQVITQQHVSNRIFPTLRAVELQTLGHFLLQLFRILSKLFPTSRIVQQLDI